MGSTPTGRTMQMWRNGRRSRLKICRAMSPWGFDSPHLHIMKTIRFSSYESFKKWFYRNKRECDFPLIERNNWWLRRQENLDMFRYVTPNGKCLGIAAVTPYESDWKDDKRKYISLFEIHRKFHRKGYGYWMFRSIENYYKSRGSTHFALMSVDDESDRFWRKLGFRRGNLSVEENDLQYRIK